MYRFLLFISFAFLGLTDSLAQSAEPLAGRVIVQLRPDVSNGKFFRQFLQKRAAALAVPAIKPLSAAYNIHLLEFPPAQADAAELMTALQLLPEVIAVQLDYRLQPRQDPNDPDYTLQWGAERINADRVWDYTTGGVTARGDDIVVAVVDFGFDIDHEDLNENIWHNPAETSIDNIDNDQNGFVDDVYGWNFVSNSRDHLRDSHGTSVAGIIGASGNNNIGVTGINWNVKIMPFSVLDVSDIIEAYDYIIDQRRRFNTSNGSQGAFVVATNLSLGIDETFCYELPIWGNMYELLGEVGILTGAGTANQSFDVDKHGDMPTSCPSDFLLTCLNTTVDDTKFSGSAFGATSIDLGAPGDGSYSTKINNRYGSFNDNSAAAPHLTGAIALLYSLPCASIADDAISQPMETAIAVREAILNGVDSLSSMQGITTTGGRLNVFRSMELMQNYCTTTTGDLDIVNVFPNPARSQVTVEYESPDFKSYELFIYNAVGQLVYRDAITPPRFASKRQPIDVSRWSPGIYFLTIERDGTRVQAKFIVQ